MTKDELYGARQVRDARELSKSIVKGIRNLDNTEEEVRELLEETLLELCMMGFRAGYKAGQDE